MAFTKDSRYAAIERVVTEGPNGPVSAIKLRRIGARSGEPHRVEPADRLDLLAHERLRDASKFWVIADANDELDASRLVDEVDRIIIVPSG